MLSLELPKFCVFYIQKITAAYMSSIIFSYQLVSFIKFYLHSVFTFYLAYLPKEVFSASVICSYVPSGDCRA